MAWIFTTDGDYVNFNGGGNLWRLHKDSNCISWHWDETGDLFFDVYDSEFTVKAENIADVVINGTSLSAASGFPAAIQAVFSGLSSPGGAGYLAYTALLTQSGTDAPVATVLENTLGGTVVWTRIDVGDYRLTLNGAFPLNKTYFPPFTNNLGAAYTLIPITTDFVTIGYWTLFRDSGDDQLWLQVVDNTFTSIDWGTLTSDDTLCLPEIRVYP